MDPNTTLADLRYSLSVGDLAAAKDSFEALDGWLLRGGLLPTDVVDQGGEVEPPHSSAELHSLPDCDVNPEKCLMRRIEMPEKLST